MKVKKLIELLQAHDPDADIVLTDADDGGYDTTLYLEVEVKVREIEHTPWIAVRNEEEPPPGAKFQDYSKRIARFPTWKQTVLSLVGKGKELWEISNLIGGNPFDDHHSNRT